MSLFWIVDPETAFVNNYERYLARLLDSVEKLCWKYAADIEAWMKKNAKWTDRTGNARQGLYAEVKSYVNAIVLSWGHSMSYGVYLELSNTGKYAIIGPALDEFAPKLFADLMRILS